MSAADKAKLDGLGSGGGIAKWVKMDEGTINPNSSNQIPIVNPNPYAKYTEMLIVIGKNVGAPDGFAKEAISCVVPIGVAFSIKDPNTLATVAGGTAGGVTNTSGHFYGPTETAVVAKYVVYCR